MIQPPLKKYYEVMDDARCLFLSVKCVRDTATYLHSSLSSLLEVHAGSSAICSQSSSIERLITANETVVRLKYRETVHLSFGFLA